MIKCVLFCHKSLTDINSTIRDFDETQKGMHTVHTLGGQQEVTFLTEFGLYEILFRSRKPIAKEFKKWLVQVIKEIRLNGQYKLDQQLKEKDEELKLLQTENQSLQSSVINILTEKEQGIIETFKGKRVFYIGKTEENIVKFGFTDDIEKRIYCHKNEIGLNFTFNYVYESYLNREIEKEIKIKYKNHRISKIYNGKNQTELIQLNEFSLEKLNKEILIIKQNIENADQEIKDTKIEELKEKISHLEKERQFIARNIESGQEIIMSSYSEANKISNIGPHSVKDNYLDKQRQSRGWTYRSLGKPYWQPPKNFKYNIAFKPSSHMIMCKSVDIKTGEIMYYNSVIEAAYFINLNDESDTKQKKETDRRTLNRAINGGKTIHPIINKYEWSKITECGTWVEP